MSDPRDSGWERALADVERSVGDCLAALDRYETAFAAVLGEPASAPAAGPVPPDDGAAPPAWESLLAAAQDRAAEVERLLAAEDAEWGRWRGALTDWRRRIEQPPGTGGAGDVQGGGDPAGGG